MTRDPVATLRISPEMRALWRALRESARGEGGDAPGGDVGPDPAQRSSGPPCRPLRLRRDGARPLLLSGEILVRVEAPACGAGGRFRLELCVAADGCVVAHLLYRPERGGCAREVHLAAELDCPESLERMLRAFEPRAAFPDAPEASPARNALRRDHARLAAVFRRVPPTVMDRGIPE